MIYIGTFNDYDNTETYQVTINAGGEVTKEFEELDIHFSPDPVHITCERSDLTQLIMIAQCQIRFKTKDTSLPNLLLANTSRSISVTVERITDESSDVLFFGYVDPLQFNQGFAYNYEEITLNCTDPLGALEQLYIQDTTVKQGDVLPIMNFIKAIFDSVLNSGATFNGIKTWMPDQINPNDIKVNAGVFYGKDDDDRMTLYDTLLELLKYLGCTVAYEPKGGTINMTSLYNVSENADQQRDWFDAKEDAMDDSGSISYDDAYNRITLTCEIEPVQDEIKLIDDEFMYSDYSTYQKYMTELVAEGNGMNAMNGFAELLAVDENHPNGEEHTSYEGGSKLDHFCYVKRSTAWTFGSNSYITAMGGVEGNNPTPMSGDQSNVLRWLKQNPCKAAFVSFGKGNKINYKDNAPINNIPMNDYLVISVCGHNDHGKNGHNLTMFNQIQANSPICKYTGLQSLNLTPADNTVINYIVISGKMILNPLQRKTGTNWDRDVNWPGGELPSNMYNASTNTYQNAVSAINIFNTQTVIGVYPALMGRTVWWPDNGGGAYYTQKWWNCADPLEPVYSISNDDGIFGFLDNKENEMLKYSWTEYGDETDVISKLPILICQLKIGDKWCVERLDKGKAGQGVFEWMTMEEWRDATKTDFVAKGFEQPYFTIGIDPKVDDKIVGRSYSIQNNISYTMNVDGSGTAIPIKITDKLNGVPEFIILGPINQEWNEIERIHPSFWRHTSWEDHLFWTLELLDSILISDLKIELKSDNARINTKKSQADNDLMYYSDINPIYTELLEQDIKICTPLTISQCETKGIKYQQSNSYVMKTNNEPFYGWNKITSSSNESESESESESENENSSSANANTNDKVKPEELYVDYFYRQYYKPAQIVEFCVDNGWAFGTPTHSNSYFGFSTILSQYTINMQYPGLGANNYYCMSMDWSLKNRANNMKVREILTYTNPFS